MCMHAHGRASISNGRCVTRKKVVSYVWQFRFGEGESDDEVSSRRSRLWPEPIAEVERGGRSDTSLNSIPTVRAKQVSENVKE